MTREQQKALDILLDVGRMLDYETQFAPLVRFVLNGSQESFAIIRKNENERIQAYCSKCGHVFCEGDINYPGVIDFVFRQAKTEKACPHCGTKFNH